jgi:glycosyltransferase involved in cell wall biosynthesis
MPCNETRDYAPEGTVRILCVGKLTERRKNQFLLIRALEFLADDFDYRVTFVGSSSLNIQNPDQNHFDALKEYASHGPLAGRVTVVPDAPFDDMMKFYRTHDVCVLPSRAEPLGTAPLEAMAQGCAAIVSSGAGSSYYVEAACEAGLPCGAVFPSGNVHALQHSLDALISDRDRLQELGQNAAQWSRREFAPDVFLRRFQALMR